MRRAWSMMRRVVRIGRVRCLFAVAAATVHKLLAVLEDGRGEP